MGRKSKCKSRPLTQAAEAHEAGMRLAWIVESSNDAIISVAPDLTIVSWNPAAEQLYGYRAEEAIGRPISIIIPSDRASDPDAMIGTLRRGGSIRHFETVRARKDGRLIDVSLTVSLVRDAAGKIIGASAIGRDITARKQAEERLTRQARELARYNAELEEFAYVAAHDLQEPLRTITCFTQLLAMRFKDKIDAEADQFIELIVSSAARMRQLLNDLLNYSRVTKGGRIELTDTRAVLQESLEALREPIKVAGATVSCGGLPTLAADPGRLRLVFENLVGNAIKYRGPEPPRVHVSAEKNDHEWIFSVEDNGIGVDPQHFERIFEMFERLHARQDYPGTGAGLALCKRIIESHHGRIWVESQPGKGSIFRFTLPAG